MMKVILYCCFFISFSLHAYTQVIFTKGEVMSGKKVIKKGSRLSNDAVLKTGAGALAIIKLSNGSKIKLTENTALNVSSMNKGKKTQVNLKRGSAFFSVLKNKFKGKRHFNVRAKTVAMGVRGTEFFVAVAAQGEKADDVWMCVREGSVAIKGKKDKKNILVGAGEGVVSKAGTQTSKPKPLPWTRKLNWNMNPKKGKVVNTVSIQEAYSDLLNFDYD